MAYTLVRGQAVKVRLETAEVIDKAAAAPVWESNNVAVATVEADKKGLTAVIRAVADGEASVMAHGAQFDVQVVSNAIVAETPVKATKKK